MASDAAPRGGTMMNAENRCKLYPGLILMGFLTGTHARSARPPWSATMIADDDPRIRHDFGYKGERAEMERFIAPYPALVALSAKIRQKTIEAWGAGDGETPDEDAWESGDPDNPGVVELVFGFQEQYATLTGALVDGFSEGGEYDYDPYFLSQG